MPEPALAPGRRMRILNPAVERELQAGVGLKLDLGCGPNPRPGYHGVDWVDLPGVDIRADLNAPLDALPDGSVAEIVTNHALEHVEQFLPLMQEIWRVLRPDGRVRMTVPHFSNVYGFSDPTHVRFFGLYSMSYFVEPDLQPSTRKVPAFYSPARFRIVSVEIGFYRRTRADRVIAKLLASWINARFERQEFYERRLSALLHAREITWVLTPEPRPSAR